MQSGTWAGAAAALQWRTTTSAPRPGRGSLHASWLLAAYRSPGWADDEKRVARRLNSEGAMLDHISIPVADLDLAAAFYDAVLETIGLHRRKAVRGSVGYGSSTSAAPCFWILHRSSTHLAQPGVGLHIAFAAPSPASVDLFYARAMQSGASDAGPPGPRPEYTQPFYGAFVRDLDGFKIEAVCRIPE